MYLWDVGTMKRSRTGDLSVVRDSIMLVASHVTFDQVWVCGPAVTGVSYYQSP